MTERAGLVPLDGSATAEAVLPWTMTLARGMGLRLVLVQVVLEAAGADAHSEAAHRYLEAVRAALHRHGVEAKTCVVSSADTQIARAITAAAQHLDVTMLLLATHGRSGPPRWVVASVADAVVRTAACPVLVARAEVAAPPLRERQLRRVLVPLDESVRAEAALEQAVPIATAFGALLDLILVVPSTASLPATRADVHVLLEERLVRDAGDYLQRVQERLPATLVAACHVLRGEPATMIRDYVTRSGADLVVMSTHGRSGLVRWMLGSVADAVMRTCPVPVLLLRPLRAAGMRTVCDDR